MPFWKRYLPLVITLFFFLVWELLSQADLLSRIFLPPPTRIFKFMYQSMVEGDLRSALFATLGRVLAGFLLGAIPGIILGWIMGRSKQLSYWFDPFIAALHPIPKIAIFPLIMFIFGIGETSKIATICITVIFPILINTIAGVRNINPVYFEVAKNYGAKRWDTIWRVIVPGSLPFVLAGVRIAINTSLVIAIAVEFLQGNKGLGVMIGTAWQILNINQMYASLFLIAFIGITINKFLDWSAYKLTPWNTGQSLKRQ